jgi:hypothetical protein
LRVVFARRHAEKCGMLAIFGQTRKIVGEKMEEGKSENHRE